MKAYFRLIRPFNCFFSALTILFGAFFKLGIANNTGSMHHVIFAGVSGFLIAAAGYVINDFFDLPIDIINKPKRPLPSKQISPKAAYIFAVFLFILGIFSSLLTANIFCVMLAFINSFLLFFYAKYFKKSYLLGNLLVAYAAGSTFIFGAFANNNLSNVISVSIFAFLLTLSREIIKDTEDIKGDKQFNAKTFSVTHGKFISTIASFIICVFTITYGIFLYKNNLQNLLIFSGFVNLPLIFMHAYLFKNNGSKNFKKISALLKADMLILLIIVSLL